GEPRRPAAPADLRSEIGEADRRRRVTARGPAQVQALLVRIEHVEVRGLRAEQFPAALHDLGPELLQRLRGGDCFGELGQMLELVDALPHLVVELRVLDRAGVQGARIRHQSQHAVEHLFEVERGADRRDDLVEEALLDAVWRRCDARIVGEAYCESIAAVAGVAWRRRSPGSMSATRTPTAGPAAVAMSAVRRSTASAIAPSATAAMPPRPVARPTDIPDAIAIL